MVSRDHARRALLALTAVWILTNHPAHAQDTGVAADVFREAMSIGTEWLGPRPSRPAAVDDPGADRMPWQGSGAMHREAAAARSIVRSWFAADIGDEQARAIIDGFAGYLQTRITEQVFDRRYLRLAHSAATLSAFGGHIVWSFPTLRLSRHAAARTDRYAAVFDALDRWIGTPALRSAMFEVAHLPADRLSAGLVVATISNVAGQDLSWLFDAAVTGVDYAVASSTADSVTVVRRGAGVFPGRTAPRVGNFDSGDAVALKVTFADGSSALARWDGRDQSRTFTFSASAPLVAAHLDPAALITLDRSRLDNSVVTPAPTNVPVGKWAARWMVWLQHTMLSYGFLA